MNKIRLSHLTVFFSAAILFFCPSNYAASSDSSNIHASGNSYVYISLDTAQCIAIYRMDTVKGPLQFVKSVGVNGSPGSLTADPGCNYLFASIRSANSISSFRIDPNTGDLIFLNSIRAAGNPVYLSTDRTGDFSCPHTLQKARRRFTL
jgi:6-phosphogluconolactonase (cycloisomerase 2 family)